MRQRGQGYRMGISVVGVERELLLPGNGLLLRAWVPERKPSAGQGIPAILLPSSTITDEMTPRPTSEAAARN